MLVRDIPKTKAELIKELEELRWRLGESGRPEAERRPETEEVYRDSGEEFRAIYNGIGEGVMVLDLETGTIINSNPALASMLGYSQEELLGMTVTSIHPPAELQRVGEEIEKGKGGENRVQDLACLRKDGSIFFVDMTGMTIDYKGRPCGAAIFNDVTKRKQAEEALKESQEILRTIFDSVPGLIFFKDKENRLVRANRVLCEALGMPEEEVEGRSLSELLPDYSEEYWKDDLEVIEIGRASCRERV